MDDTQWLHLEMFLTWISLVLVVAIIVIIKNEFKR